MNKKTKGFLEMMGATFIWGSVPIFGVISNLPSAVFVFFRVLFGLPFILYFAFKHEGIGEFFRLKPFWPILLSGIMLGINWVFFFWAVNLTDISSVVVIYYAGPIVSVLLAVLFLGEKFHKTLIFSLVLAVMGVLFSSGMHISANKGVILAILAGISYGFLGFFSKIATMHHKSISITAWQILISACITFPFLFLNEWHMDFGVFVVVLIAGIIHTAFALFLWYDALRYISVSFASVLAYSDIFFAISLAYFALGQIPNQNQIIGGVLVMLAGTLSSIKELR